MRTPIPVIGMFVLLIAASIAAAPQSTGSKPVKVKPDIEITEVSAIPPPIPPEGVHNIQIKVTVANPNLGSSTGPFKILCQVADRPGFEVVSDGLDDPDLYAFLGEAEVASLVNTGAASAAPSRTVFFSDSIPRGKRHKYWIIVDQMNVVAETNEINNRRYIYYTAR
jgi:hypothetical protein